MRLGVPLGMALVAAAVAAQEPAQRPAPQPPPVFEAGVDLVAVDVSVVDPQGRPLLGLQPADFEIEVDGRARVVASTEYVGRELEVAQPAKSPALYSSNDDAPSGRLVLLLVDRGNIGRGGGRTALAAADRFLGTLAASDRVGLAVVPSGPSVDFTAEHDEVRRGLKLVVGQADRGASQVPLREALALVQENDRFRWQQFAESQCASLDAQQREQCRAELEVEAQQVVMSYRERSQQSRRALETVFQSLRSSPGPKTVVLISEGLAVDSPAETRRLAEAAAEAQVTLFVLLLESSGVSAQYQRRQLATAEERDLETGPIYDLAGLARGAVLPVVGTADAPFQRIARELMGYYLVGFEPLSGDRDGRNHDVRVRVKRDAVTVRARGVLSIPASPPSAREAIGSALRSPLVERGLRLRVASYARPAPAGKVKLLLAAEVTRAKAPVSVGFALLAADGKAVASQLVEGLSGGLGEPVLFSGEATVDAGAYTLRVAAVDAGGRRGSVHHPAKVAVVTAGGLLISDLVLAAPSSDALQPVVDLEAGAGGLVALVELAGRGAASASVALELADKADGPPLVSVPIEASPPDRDGLRVARAAVTGGLLPPGEYVARAAIAADGRAVASVTRPFRIAAQQSADARRDGAVGQTPAHRPLAALVNEQRPYDRGELLAPETLGYFLDRMTELVPGPLPEGTAAAIAEARAGRAAAMGERLPSSGTNDARVAFLRGVSYYAANNLNAALTQLQVALRARSDFFPAAVYMGACYAAGGKDQDAIGAWQTALIGETGSPALYSVLSDALLRVREAEQAVAILDEGLAAYTQDEGLRRRLAMAHAMAGKPDALNLLTAWVDAHPEDTRALFATLALLFDGFSRDAAGGVSAEEQQRLRRYARAYIDAKGPNKEVIDRWLRYLESRSGS